MAVPVRLPAIPAPPDRLDDGSTAYQATVIGWNDGDSLWVRVDSGISETAWACSLVHVRLGHVDTPELVRTNPAYGDAVAAWETAKAIAPAGAVVTFTQYEVEKYGRGLGQITNMAGVSVASELLRLGLAAPYEGGTR